MLGQRDMHIICEWSLAAYNLACCALLSGPAKTCRSAKTALASELEAQGPLGALVSYY